MALRGSSRGGLAHPVHTFSPMWRFAATSVVMWAGCYTPSYANCAVACESAADCAPGHSCTSAGLCAAAGAVCEATSLPDAAPPDAALPPPSPVGAYVMIFTNRENGCAFPSWVVGATSNVDVQISLNGAVVVGAPQGLAAGFLDLWLGAHVFAGTQTGDHLVLVLAGNKSMSHGNCDYTIDASLDVALTGDLLQGDLVYRARTNNAPACGELTGCSTRQSLNGTRAPR